MEEEESSLAVTEPSEIGKIIGNFATIKEEDGAEIVVPLDTASNVKADRILAAQGRHLLQEMIKKYRANGDTMAPAEIKAVMDAIKSVASVSGPLYNPRTGEIEDDEAKLAKKLSRGLSSISFEALTKKAEPANQNESGQGNSQQEGEAKAVPEE